MNFYDLNQGQGPMMNNQMPPQMIPEQNLYYKLNDLENRLKKLELRIQRLESSQNDNNQNYNEPDTGLYMI